jgi:hypothetical protein
MQVLTTDQTIIQARAVRIRDEGVFSYQTVRSPAEEWLTKSYLESSSVIGPYLRLVAAKGKLLFVRVSDILTNEDLLTISASEAELQHDNPHFLFVEGLGGLHLQIDGHDSVRVLIEITEEETQ